RADRAGLADPLRGPRPPPQRRGPGRGVSPGPGRAAGRGGPVRGVTIVAMSLRDALEVLAAHRGRRIVISTMSAAGAWPQFAGTGHTDFAALARGAGIGRVYAFATLAEWRTAAAEALAGEGPVVVWLKVEGRLGQKTPSPPRPMAEQIARLKQALGV